MGSKLRAGSFRPYGFMLHTQAGLEALGWYHERKDDVRSVGLGPEHDWSSHAADAFGLMCLVAEAGFRGSRLRGKGTAMAV
ncbi:MAG: hypothetical protein ACKO3C_05410 [Betaproteobacteria bacterium]